MNQLSGYILRFFQRLTIGADLHGGHHYKDFIENAVERFLRNETKDTAYQIYHIFLETYGYASGTEGISFIRLLEKMRSYEENAAVLTSAQRDHFVHSVNVFLLGLAVYQCSPSYQEAFYRTCFKGCVYHERQDTPVEEFFYRWGMAALCHDIGYPIEIITNQINDFINFANQLRKADRRIFAHVEYDRFELVNMIPEEIKKRDFIAEYFDKHESCVYIDLLKPVDLLAHRLHIALGVDLQAVKAHLDTYVAESGKTGRVDHGFFSALILLKWYGYLIQISNGHPDQLYYPVLDSASAILLHNFYGIGLVQNNNRPDGFNLGPLEPSQHPIGYLLILCDELQEWNREPYGEQDKLRPGVATATITADDARLDVTYLVDKGTMPEEFVGKKVNTLNTLLNLSAVFPKGFSVGCESTQELPLPQDEVPPLLLGKLEQLAIAIHHRYNQTTRRLHPDKVIEFPNFSDLPKEKKFYNLRSAMEYPQELLAVGCEIRVLDPENTAGLVTEFTGPEIEVLAEYEHERWQRSRAEQGWAYGPVRDDARKLNPHMVPYSALGEKIKEYDRDPARNIPTLLREVGLGAYRRSPVQIDSFSAEEIEILARKIHGYYNERTKIIDPKAKLIPFDELSKEKKNANRRQARGIPNKLRHIGCVLLPIGTEGRGEPVTSFNLDTIEMLARIEHDEWGGEKVINGWIYGEKRDDRRKINPYLVSYDQLDEPIKEYDRDSVRNMPELAKACGYAIYAQ